MGASDAGLQHASAPDRNSALFRGVMDCDGLAEAADAADFDVDDAAGLHSDSGQSVAAVSDRLIEADVRAEALLQHGMEVKVVVPERLLDHNQVELIPAYDVVQISHPIGRVGVATQDNLGPSFADGFEEGDIHAGFALEFDALIAGGEFGGDFVQQLLDRGLQADGHATGYDFAVPAKEFGEGDALGLRFEVPDSIFERGLGHAMASNLSEDTRAASTAFHICVKETWRKFGFGDHPGGIDHLVTEVRMLARNAFTPPSQAVGFEFQPGGCGAQW